jgi:hypothetical protein
MCYLRCIHRGAERALARRLRRLTASALDLYRPELHYMRGPGPWREKMQKSAAKQDSAEDERTSRDRQSGVLTSTSHQSRQLDIDP